MGTGLLGTFVISWSQSEVNGNRAAPVSALKNGALWSWNGDAVRVDGPNGLLRQERGEGDAILRRRAARTVRKVVGASLPEGAAKPSADFDDPMMDDSFVVTDGVNTYTITLIMLAGQSPLLMFLDDVPPRGEPMRVMHMALNEATGTASEGAARQANGLGDPSKVICFAPGTLIDTPYGARAIERLHEGDLINTKDNGVQEITWIGSRRMTGARLFTFPKLRPIRIKAGALGEGFPDRDLIVSPDHKFVVHGDVAEELFNTSEVLVSARELENARSIATDFTLREVTYMHLMLPRHEIIFANGVETESFHPADMDLETMGDDDRNRLLMADPDLAQSPYAFGAHARRSLTQSEAALLLHKVA